MLRVPFSQWLVVMVKAPVSARVKSRLARQVGLSRATAFYRHATTAVLARVGRDPRWRTVLSVTPDHAMSARFWPASLPRIPQGRGDLGARMQGIFETLPPGPVLIVGSDIPGISPTLIADAFCRLRAADAVLAPAEDGGYWLVGLKRRPRLQRPFWGVRWSTPQALDDTLANLAGARITMAAKLRDVDEAQDLDAAPSYGRRVLPRWPHARELIPDTVL
jgi:rSAM/selenodomain-associated transferase 1